MTRTFSCRQLDDSSAAKYARLNGIPKDEVRNEAFLQETRYLEQNDGKQITIHDIINHMRSGITEKNCEPYSFPYIKSKLLKHFAESIIIAEINGKPNVVTFYSTAYRILHDFHS